MTVSADSVIAAYIKLRTHKAALAAKHKAEVAEIDAKMGQLDHWLRASLGAQGATSMKTTGGTAYLKNTSYASVKDWKATLDYIKQNDAWELLERRVSKTAVAAVVENQNTMVPGVDFGYVLTLNVRKPGEEE